MIGALQTVAPVAPSRTEARPAVSQPEAVATPRAPVDNPGRGFTGQRGARVDGSSLVLAQEEAGKTRKPVEEKSEQPGGRASELSEADRERVRELQARDREVRAHEQAHARVGGQHAGSPSYEMERGPDGRSYAVGGHVSISTAPVPGDPEATIRKMEQVRRAALAPAEPSGPDRRVAADAVAKRADAQAELNTVRREETAAQFDGEEATDEAPAPIDAPEGIAETENGTQSPFGLPGEPALPNGLVGGESGTGRDTRTAGEPGNQGGTPLAGNDAAGLTGDTGTDSSANGESGGPGIPSQPFEAFTRTLDRALEGLGGIAAGAASFGGVSRQDIGQADPAQSLNTTRRTGVDIRV